MRNFSPFVFFLICFCLPNSTGFAQDLRYPMPAPNLTQTPQANTPQVNAPQTILDVRIEGNLQVPTADILKIIKTRPGRPFSEPGLEDDKRALMQKTWFVDVRPKVTQTTDGYIITYQCIERQLIHYIKISGNSAHTKATLLEEANIKVGDALDPIAIQQARARMEQFYRESGFHLVHIDVHGGEFGDRGVVFNISEGARQRVLSVDFQGNKIASSQRLKTLIQSKPGFFFWYNSEFTRKKLDDDVEVLTDYYRKLGFFHAKVDRKFEETNGYTGMRYFREDPNRAWIKVKYIIDEGPRSKIRDIRFTGNNVFDEATLLKKMKLSANKNQFYHGDMLEVDMQTIKNMYGDEGYVFAMPMPNPVVDQDYVDLIITIREGPRCSVGTLDVEIIGMDGVESYTKWYPVLNRVSLKPGDLLRTSEINASRRRLIHSQLFNANPTQGPIPDFQFEYPLSALEMEETAEREAMRMASGDPQIRGQAPQSVPFVPIVPSYSPDRLAEPTLRFVPQSQVPLQMAPQTAPPAPSQTMPQTLSATGMYRGQAPINYAQSVYTPAPPPQAQTYTPVNAYNPMYPGSVASAPAPLQMPNAQTPNTSAAGGMVHTQYRPSDVLRANPYDTLHSPANVRFDPSAPPGASPYIHETPVKVVLQETRTGSVMASVAISSDAGLMGRFIFDEQNFDITNFPKGFRLIDWRNAFRGKGQRFRLEAVPGTQVQRYSAMWETPYLFNLDYSFGVNGFYYQRHYDEWSENRLGGAISFGKLWTPDFSTLLSLGAQSVNVYRPSIPVLELWQIASKGRFPMYNIELRAVHNTRDSEYMPTEGHLVSAGIEQVLGEYQFLRGSVDLRKYIMLRERPDRSGRWVLGLRSSVGITEGSTPIIERYYGGGFTNLRGFEFRGVSPRDWSGRGDVIGGCFEFYNSAEMIFPLTADDMIRGSVFIDTGTVEKKISKWEDNYRVAVGFGLRLTIPMMGPAPIALDFAFPLSTGRGDDKQVFSFGMTMMR